MYNCQFGDRWSPVYSFKVPPKSDPNTWLKIITFWIKMWFFTIYSNSLPSDMGEAQSDGSLQPIYSQVPSLQTTHLVESDMPMIDLVLHIGDIWYARG